MTKDNWTSVESSLDEIKSEIDGTKEELASLDELRLGHRVQDVLNTVYNCLSNIEQYADAIYTTCEDDYCSSEAEPDKEIPEEILEVLPSDIALGQVLDLAETIKEWRNRNGLGIFD